MEHLPQIKPGDPVGLETLEALSEAERLNEWMFNTIRPYCNSPVLEIGSGIGNISRYFLQNNFEITLTDLRPEYCQVLNKKFEDNSHLMGVEMVDLVHPEFDKIYSKLFNKFNTIYALNVVEHIEDDYKAIENCKKLLKKGGILIILVPAYNWLYNKFDEELGHYRRYTKKTLSKVFKNADFEIVHRQYFNLAATFGWFWYGKVLGRKVLPKGPIETYNKLVPLFKIADKTVFNLIGNSVIIVGKKP